MKQHQQLGLATLETNSSSYNCKYSRNKINPSSYSFKNHEKHELYHKLLVPREDSAPSARDTLHAVNYRFSSILRSLVKIILASCKWFNLTTHLSITPSLGRKVTGTLFGHRRGRVSFAIQDDPRSEPVLLIELAMSTASLVKEMLSGWVRIALESEKAPNRTGRLFHEPIWSMYCNGRKSGYAATRTCTESDWHVLSTVQSVSVGAGVIPMVEDAGKGCRSEGELFYMRAKFDRVVGSRDSEAFYMLNPDNNGGPELSIFLLRI